MNKKITQELIIANKELVFQNEEKQKRAAELSIANKELEFQNAEKIKRAAELVIAHEELLYQNIEKGKRNAELTIANEELAFQNEEKGKRAEELIIADKELVFQNEEKIKRASELTIANKELEFQKAEKLKRAEELVIANEELLYQNEEKEKRNAELTIANEELAYQNEEKGKRAEELIIADKELVFQNEEKLKRAAELTIANKELEFQKAEKLKRAEELVIANEELLFQNAEKSKRNAELTLANEELAFQNEEKEKRAEELIIADRELIFQKGEKFKRAAELRIINDRLSFHIENTPLGFIEWNHDLKLKSWSKRAEEIFGWREEELMANETTALSTVYEDDLPWVSKMMAQLISGDVLRNRFQYRSYTKDRRLIWCECFNSVLLEKDGWVTTVMSLVEDITERKEAENHLRMLESAITNANDSVLITEAGQLEEPGPKILYVNDAFTKMTGYTSDEVIGKTPRIFQGIKTDRQQLDKIRQALTEHTSVEVEIINYKKNGEEFWANFIVVPVADKDGLFTHCVSIQRDVTTRKRAEEIARTKLEMVVAERTRELQAALSNEKEVVEMKNKFISIASHEFRTPLATISFAVESIRKYSGRLTPEEIGKKLLKIEDQASHMTNLLEDILTLGKSEAGKIKVVRINLDLKEFIDSLIEEARATVKEKREIKFTFSCARSSLNTDDKLLRNIFNNLLTNALKFSDAHTCVEIDISDYENNVLIRVSDRGIGIAKEDLDGIFDSFQRGSNASAVQGTGLGLSILKKAVELLGGSIHVESVLNNGSIFSILLPVR